MVRYIFILVADDLATLRTAASPVFLKPSFVSGPFAQLQGTQTDESDVAVIVIEMPKKFYCPLLSLEDEIYKVWGRKPDIIPAFALQAIRPIPQYERCYVRAPSPNPTGTMTNCTITERGKGYTRLDLCQVP